MPRRSFRFAPGVPVAGAVLVISRLRISQYCWLCSLTVEVTRLAPSIRGRAPLPYEERTIGLPAAPEPFGHSCPDHAWPALQQHLIAWPERRRVDLGQRLPGRRRTGAGVGVVAAGGVHVVVHRGGGGHRRRVHDHAGGHRRQQRERSHDAASQDAPHIHGTVLLDRGRPAMDTRPVGKRIPCHREPAIGMCQCTAGPASSIPETAHGRGRAAPNTGSLGPRRWTSRRVNAGAAGCCRKGPRQPGS